ncbi:D-alanyl-D-alanine carboxypeptidase family protein [Falsibacillus albus]|uniref:serine-type D-Ala-D-Ala carboxypeptidase n=1 Tax=Falsibacillus albus TaxID=2478915 RepID=A0A3L7JW14_9BACI|nr:D-alanyl-D-alanine carboxypeptidase family protein [Falsibacillus albus]RLQ95047.1 D-alanyl-D-alanine carboxypeptidase [Falsibacillus albus]
MKIKYIYIYIMIMVAASAITPNLAKADTISLSAQSAILMDQDSGRVLYEKDAHQQLRIASITKIMTAIIAIESGKLNKKVKVSKKAVYTEGSSIYLKQGEKIKLEDLVYGLMLRSGNDAAVAIAEYVGGSEEGFVYLMNKKAEEIGMKHTHFANPHGLDDHENHFSTAYDMALLMKYAMHNKEFKKISGTKVYHAEDPDSQWERTWRNKNRLLTEKYEYCTGGKTGYTKRAKRTLVTTASKDGQNLIAVTLNASDDWNDHIEMYNFGFNQYDQKIVLPEGKIDAVKNKFYQNKVFIKQDVTFPLKENETDLVRVKFELLKPDEKWKKNHSAPEIVGNAKIYFNEKNIRTVPIYFEPGDVNEASSWLDLFQGIFLAELGVMDNG